MHIFLRHTYPLFCIIAASWLVLFPGAAQASITWAPTGGDRSNAGRQLAYKNKVKWAHWQYLGLVKNITPFLEVILTLSCSMRCPAVYNESLWKSVLGEKTNRSGMWESWRNLLPGFCTNWAISSILNKTQIITNVYKMFWTCKAMAINFPIIQQNM